MTVHKTETSRLFSKFLKVESIEPFEYLFFVTRTLTHDEALTRI
jgi:hypothetical protein